MRFFNIKESSPLTFQGSITPDLLISKLWLAQILKRLGYKQFSRVYVLGSWYGNMGYVLIKKSIKFDQIINVEKNLDWLEFSEQLLSSLGAEVESIHGDANYVKYRDLTASGLVINTSVQEISGFNWFDNIPTGVLVALEYRSDGGNIDLIEKLPFSKTLYQGQRDLKDPETDYTRYLKIGIK